MLFSTENQPKPAQRLRTQCQRGHSLEPGNPNVRLRSADGKRVCRACESDRNSKRYRSAIAQRSPIPAEFSLDNLSYSVERYEKTPLEILAPFAHQQEKWLKAAQAAKPGMRFPLPGGGSIIREFMIEHLEQERPITSEIVLRKLRERQAQENGGNREPQSNQDQ